jgi:hypothetical protein
VLSLSYAIPSTTLYVLYYLRQSVTVEEKEKAAADELDARAEANSYQRKKYREEDSRRDGNKHEDTVGKIKDVVRGPEFQQASRNNMGQRVLKGTEFQDVRKAHTFHFTLPKI